MGKKAGKPKRYINKYLQEPISYGGEIRTRGSVIRELQTQGMPQKYIDAYMMGARTVKQNPGSQKITMSARKFGDFIETIIGFREQGMEIEEAFPHEDSVIYGAGGYEMNKHSLLKFKALMKEIGIPIDEKLQKKAMEVWSESAVVIDRKKKTIEFPGYKHYEESAFNPEERDWGKWAEDYASDILRELGATPLKTTIIGSYPKKHLTGEYYKDIDVLVLLSKMDYDKLKDKEAYLPSGAKMVDIFITDGRRTAAGVQISPQKEYIQFRQLRRKNMGNPSESIKVYRGALGYPVINWIDGNTYVFAYKSFDGGSVFKNVATGELLDFAPPKGRKLEVSPMAPGKRPQYAPVKRPGEWVYDPAKRLIYRRETMKNPEEGYSGWKNRETWNVALWMGGDEGWYDVARNSSNYSEFVGRMQAAGITKTPDGYSLTDKKLDRKELNEVIEEFHEGEPEKFAPTPKGVSEEGFVYNPNKYILLRDNKVLFEGTENECYMKLQRVQGQSWDYALKHGGYSIVPVSELPAGAIRTPKGVSEEGFVYNPTGYADNPIQITLHRGGYPTLISEEVAHILRAGRRGEMKPSDYKTILKSEYKNIGRGPGYSSGNIWRRHDGWQTLEEIFNSEIGAFVLRLKRHSTANPEITPAEAKHIIKTALTNRNLPFTKLTARTVGFSDLARGECVFVKVHGWKPSSAAGEIEIIARQNGFRVEFSGMFSNPSHNPLTDEQINQVMTVGRQKIAKNAYLRILIDGQAMNVQTGEVASRGSNVIYHPCLWEMNRDAANMILQFIKDNNPGHKVTMDYQPGTEKNPSPKRKMEKNLGKIYKEAAKQAFRDGIDADNQQQLVAWIRQNCKYDSDKEFFLVLGIGSALADLQAQKAGYESEVHRAYEIAKKKTSPKRKMMNELYDLAISQDPKYSPPSKFWSEDRDKLWKHISNMTTAQLKESLPRQRAIAETTPEEIARHAQFEGLIPNDNPD